MLACSQFLLPLPSVDNYWSAWCLCNLPLLGISHKWNKKNCKWFFTLHIFGFHPCCSMYQQFVPFCCYIVFHWVYRSIWPETLLLKIQIYHFPVEPYHDTYLFLSFRFLLTDSMGILCSIDFLS